MPTTLLLDQKYWDLVLDANGNIALASDPYSTAQSVANACRTFLSELWYDTTQGVPYFGQILGYRPSLGFVKAQLIATAMTVPEVASVTCYITGVINRNLIGQLQITTTSGTTLYVTMTEALPWYISGAGSDAQQAQSGTALINNGGVLTLPSGLSGYPISPAGLAPGAVWTNGRIVGVVFGGASSGPILFSNITVQSLLSSGAPGLPTSAPSPAGSGQLWNNAGVICIA